MHTERHWSALRLDDRANVGDTLTMPDGAIHTITHRKVDGDRVKYAALVDLVPGRMKIVEWLVSVKLTSRREGRAEN